ASYDTRPPPSFPTRRSSDLGLVVPQPEVLVLHPQAQQPLVAEIFPVGEPLQLRAGLAEELQFHLLKLPGAEGEVARGDLVAEARSEEHTSELQSRFDLVCRL